MRWQMAVLASLCPKRAANMSCWMAHLASAPCSAAGSQQKVACKHGQARAVLHKEGHA